MVGVLDIRFFLPILWLESWSLEKQRLVDTQNLQTSRAWNWLDPLLVEDQRSKQRLASIYSRARKRKVLKIT